MFEPGALVTAEELERCSGDDERYELVEGRVVCMSPVGFEHGRIVSRLIGLLDHHVRARDFGIRTHRSRIQACVGPGHRQSSRRRLRSSRSHPHTCTARVPARPRGPRDRSAVAGGSFFRHRCENCRLPRRRCRRSTGCRPGAAHHHVASTTVTADPGGLRGCRD